MRISDPRFFLGTCAALMLSSMIGCGSSGDDSPGVTASINSGAEPTSETGLSSGTVPVSTGISSDNATQVPSTPNDPARPRQAVELHPVVLIRTNLGDIKVQLDSENAPMTVDNFIAYVESEFYANTIFHYVEQGYMISAGGFTENGESKETRALVLNEAHNGLKNLRGTIAMARDPQYKHSADSQFYINLVDNPSLDHQSDESDSTYGYCVFGKVVEGMDVVDKIAAVPVTTDDRFVKRPEQSVVIEKVERIK